MYDWDETIFSTIKTQIPVTAVLAGNVEASDTTPPITGMSFEMDNGACTVVTLVREPLVKNERIKISTYIIIIAQMIAPSKLRK